MKVSNEARREKANILDDLGALSQKSISSFFYLTRQEEKRITLYII